MYNIIKSYPLCVFLCLYLTVLNLNLNLSCSHRRFTHSIVRHAILFQFERISFFVRSFLHIYFDHRILKLFDFDFLHCGFFFTKRVVCIFMNADINLHRCISICLYGMRLIGNIFCGVFIAIFFLHSIFIVLV